jgi:bacterial/archaeal transporter family-2 protein
MQHPALVLMALGAGALLAAQGPILSRLAAYAGGPVQAAVVAFSIGLVALAAASLATGAGLPHAGAVLRMPPWLWAAGLIGTALLLLTLHAVPRIGVAAFTASVVCGQLLAALFYDHVGALGMEVRRAGLREVAGVALLLGGLVLIAGEDRG